MKCCEVENLLVAMAEGSISAEDRLSVDLHLSVCDACTKDAELLSETFSMLSEREEYSPPANYFTTLLPSVHSRLEHGAGRWNLAMPVWLENVLAPLTVTAMAMIALGLFRLFEPTEEFTPLYALLGQASTEEIVALSATENDAFGNDAGITGYTKILDMFPNANSVAEKMKSALLADELTVQQTEEAILSNETMLDELDDDAISQVLNRLDNDATL